MKTKCFLLASILATSPLLAADVRTVEVDCAKGETIAGALTKGKNAEALEIVIRGTCEEVVTVDRDRVTVRGADAAARVIGLIGFSGASGITIRDLSIRGGTNHPTTGDFAGINALGGSAVHIENVRIDDIRARGIQGIESAISLRNVEVSGARGGAFSFRSSSIVMKGTIVGNNCPFGMSLANSGATADGADLTFNDNIFGLIVQINSGFEHIIGHLSVANNFIGVLVAGQGIFAVGSFVDVRNNFGFGMLIDELSSYTPLVGVPGGGPALKVVDNAGPGISVERGSTFEVLKDTVVSGNQIGIRVDNSVLRLADADVHGNAEADVSLAFGAKGEFGADNSIGTPIVCDSSVLTRGTLGCGASAIASRAGASSARTRRTGVVSLEGLADADER